MKRVFALTLALLCLLFQTGCGPAADETGAANPEPETTSSEPETEPSVQPEDEPLLSAQDMAQQTYEQILNAFGGLTPDDPGYPNYPEEFADAYYEDGTLVLCLTDISRETQEKYLALTDHPEILQFREVGYSFNDLYALFMAITSMEDLTCTSAGVNVTENRVDLGVPEDVGQEQALAIIQEQLPQELKDRFSTLPISVEIENYVTTAVE
jgi:hypothetical protein